MMDWNPIISAPKNTKLLLWIEGEENEDNPLVGYWNELVSGPKRSDGWWVVHYGKLEGNPTHWMVCPNPPPEYRIKQYKGMKASLRK